jgi:predicted phosphohydrolase
MQLGHFCYTGQPGLMPFATLGFAPFVFSPHAEDDNWGRLREALALLPAELECIGVGIPKGGCAMIHSDGTLEPKLKPLVLLNGKGTHSLPSGKAFPRQKLLALSEALPRAAAGRGAVGGGGGGGGGPFASVEVIRALPIPDPLRKQEAGTLRLVMISDTHSFHRRIPIPPGDVLVHSGDFCDGGSLEELEDFCAWLDEQPHSHKVVVAGNHDWCLDAETAAEVRRDRPSRAPPGVTEKALVRMRRSCHYLEDSGVTICGLSFWGSPWQPEFEGAFNLRRGRPLRAHWDLVPSSVDVLLTHTPPAGHLDRAHRAGSVGCGELMRCIERVRPQLNVFGHIHEGYGLEEQDWMDARGGETLYVNAASVDVTCSPIHTPIVVDLPLPAGHQTALEEAKAEVRKSSAARAGAARAAEARAAVAKAAGEGRTPEADRRKSGRQRKPMGITCEELILQLDSATTIVVDVRALRTGGHVPGAWHTPSEHFSATEVLDDVQSFATDTSRLVFYAAAKSPAGTECAVQACSELAQRGSMASMEVYTLNGGYDAWSASGFVKCGCYCASCSKVMSDPSST